MTADEAIRRIPRRKRIHTMLGFMGADWSRDEVVAALRAADEDRIVENRAFLARDHGIAILRYSSRGNPLLIETKVPS